jgi:hypothetical protein
MTLGRLPTIMLTAMQSGAEAAKDLRALIIEALRTRAYRPVELFKALQGPGVSEARLKDALDALIDEHRLELSPDRFFKLRLDQPDGAR